MQTGGKIQGEKIVKLVECMSESNFMRDILVVVGDIGRKMGVLIGFALS